MNPYGNNPLAALMNLGGLAANAWTDQQYWMNQMQAQQQQAQQNYALQHLLGNGFTSSQPGMAAYYEACAPPPPARCAYCGKKPKLSTDDRCDGCGAPR